MEKRFGILLFLVLIISLPGCATKSATKSSWAEYGITSKHQFLEQESVPGLTAAISSPNVRIRRQALRYLSRLGIQAKEAVPEVKRIILQDPTEANKIYAIRVLSEISYDKDDVIPFLKENLAPETNTKIKDAYISTINHIEGTSGVINLVINNEISPKESTRIVFRTDYKYYNGYRRIDMVRNSGILPIKIEITNNTTSGIKVNPDSLNLYNPNNIRAGKPFESSVAKEQQLNIAKNTALSFILFAPGAGASMGRAIDANVKIENYFRENVFKKFDIEAGGTSTGYIYFEVPKETRRVKNWEIKLIVDANDITHNAYYKFK